MKKTIKYTELYKYIVHLIKLGLVSLVHYLINFFFFGANYLINFSHVQDLPVYGLLT